MKINIFDLSRTILEKEKNMNINDSCIKFANGEIFMTNKLVLAQLEIFKNILTDFEILPKINEIDKILEIDEGKNFVNKKIFMFFYERLKKMYLLCSKIDLNNKLEQYQEQVNYILLLDYLTNPEERPPVLFQDIDWHDLFWISLLSTKFQNIHTYFDWDKRKNAYVKCLSILRTHALISEKEEDVVWDYFGWEHDGSICPKPGLNPRGNQNGHLEVLDWCHANRVNYGDA